MRTLSRTPIATDNAVDVADLADHLRVTTTEAASALRYAAVAAQELEAYIPVALLSQTIEAQGEPISGVSLFLPVGPASAQTVTVTDADGTSLPHLFTPGRHPLVTLDAAHEGAVTVVYEAGFGGTTADVPSDLAHAVLDQALRLFDLRGDIDGPSVPAPAFSRICARYRRVGMGT